MTRITRADIFKILDARKSLGQMRMTNVLLADLKQLFNFALDRELIKSNPIATIKKDKAGGADTKRERALSKSEISMLFKALPHAGLSQRAAIAIQIVLATGCRIGELMGASWNDAGANVKELRATANATDVKYGVVDLSARTWYLPDTKNQRDHTIHLSDFAVSKFRELEAIREVTPWVFPGRSGTKPVCVKSIGKQLADRQRPPEKRMKNRTSKTGSLALENGRWTAHDLRRTAATQMAGLGVSSDVILEATNHKSPDKMGVVYIRNRRQKEQATAFDLLGKHLAAIVNGTEAESNVIEMRGHRRRV